MPSFRSHQICPLKGFIVSTHRLSCPRPPPMVDNTDWFYNSPLLIKNRRFSFTNVSWLLDTRTDAMKKFIVKHLLALPWAIERCRRGLPWPPYFRGYSRELVSKPAIFFSIKNSRRGGATVERVYYTWFSFAWIFLALRRVASSHLAFPVRIFVLDFSYATRRSLSRRRPGFDFWSSSYLKEALYLQEFTSGFNYTIVTLKISFSVRYIDPHAKILAEGKNRQT